MYFQLESFSLLTFEPYILKLTLVERFNPGILYFNVPVTFLSFASSTSFEDASVYLTITS